MSLTQIIFLCKTLTNDLHLSKGFNKGVIFLNLTLLPLGNVIEEYLP